MYLSQSDIFNLQLNLNNNYKLSDFLKELINEDRNSKEKLEMIEGLEYYKGNHNILSKDFREYYIDGLRRLNRNKSNNLIINAFHKYLVDQKVGYIAGHPVTFTGKEQSFVDLVNDNLSFWFNKTLQKWIRNSSNKGKEFIYVFVNDSGEFDYTVIPGEQIIPVYDTRFNETLTRIIRYYTITWQRTPRSPKEEILKVEVYDENTVFYLVEQNGKLVADPDYPENPRYHIYRINSMFPDQKSGRGWGRPPFIELKNNDEAISDLRFTKSLIDNYDYNLSSFSNNLADIAKAVWVLKGYEGTKLSEFMSNLNAYNAIKVGAQGGVEAKTNDIPEGAHNSHLERIEDNIYVFGFGVNPKINKAGLSPSGIALEYMYAGLDLKSNIAITEATAAIHEFLRFLSDYYAFVSDKKFNPDKVEPVFNKHLIINEAEKITSVRNSLGVISRQTAIANHPWVNDPNVEMKLIEEEESSRIDLDGIEEEQEGEENV